MAFPHIVLGGATRYMHGDRKGTDMNSFRKNNQKPLAIDSTNSNTTPLLPPKKSNTPITRTLTKMERVLISQHSKTQPHLKLHPPVTPHTPPGENQNPPPTQRHPNPKPTRYTPKPQKSKFHAPVLQTANFATPEPRLVVARIHIQMILSIEAFV